MNQRTDKCPYCVKKHGDYSTYGNYEKQEVITNGDKIRQMTDAELAASFIKWETYGADYCDPEYCDIEKQCHDCIPAWLQKEAD